MIHEKANARPQIAIAATLHDPDQRFLPLIRTYGDRLQWYSTVAVAMTVTTATSIQDELEARGVLVTRVALGPTGEARRVALRSAALGQPSALLSCDFDRWLHWVNTYPDELRTIGDQVAALDPVPWYVCLGRTARAFATHPRVQRETEATTNHVLELVTGWPVDATAGASWFSPEGYEIVLAQSNETTSATDLEWPALIHQAAPDRLKFLAAEGLEFETAIFYAKEIAEAGGLEAWITDRYERPSIWAQRLKLAADSVAALTRVIARSR